MGTTSKVSVPALRILTYTILIKAVISAVKLICTTTAGVGLLSANRDLPGIGSIYAIAQTAGFINIVACVMCLGGIAALSKQFISTLRIMVAVLLIECFILLPVTGGLYLAIINNTAAMSAVSAIILSLAAAERLLIGAAFLFLMKGFGENLREEGDSVSAATSERLSVIYLCCSAAGVIVMILLSTKSGIALLAADTILSLAGVILEILMYIRASDAAFRIWRSRAFSDH